MFKKYFITGIISIIPVYVTYWIIQKVFFIVSIPGKTIISYILKLLNIGYSAEAKYILIIEYTSGFLLTLLFFITLGLIVSNVIGKRIYSSFEYLLNSIPLVNKFTAQ